MLRWLVLLLFLPACDGTPAHVVLRVEDPHGVATGFERLEVGISLEALERVALARSSFPLSITVTAGKPGESDVWVQASDASGAPLARGHTLARFARKGTPTASVSLAAACADAAACDDELYCNGAEACVDGICRAGTDPCGASFSCVVSTCIEASAQCDVSVDHERCESGTYCDPMRGCVPGERCQVDADCQDSSYCNGAEVCVGFRCAPGDLPDVDDGDDCTIDGCNDASMDPELHIPDPGRDGNACTRPNGGGPGICLATEGGCVESLCGDGFVDSPAEDCDDGVANPNDGCHQCQHTAWAPEVVLGHGSSGNDPLLLDLRSPQGLAVDRNGRIFIADSSNACVWLVDPSGAVTVAAGTGETGDEGDGGPAAQARLYAPKGLTVDWAGNLYIADEATHRVREVCFDPAGCGGMSLGEIATVAGTGVSGDASGDGGPATLATLNTPQDVAIDGLGNLFIADTHNNRIRHVCMSEEGCDGLAPGEIATIAGTDLGGGELVDDVPATDAELAMPFGVAVDQQGNVIISDSQHNVIRQVCRVPAGCDGALFGYISRVAGDGTWGAPLGDGGPADQAGLFYPAGVAVDHENNVLIGDMANDRIRIVCRQDAGCGTLETGFIDTLAGGGTVFADGVQAVDTILDTTWHAVADVDGNVLISDSGHRRLRRVCRIPGGCPDGSLWGEIVTVVGGSSARAHDGTLATSAPLRLVYGVAIGPDGDIYLGDGTNHTIAHVCRAAGGCGALDYGEIETVAGNGDYDASGDGAPALGAGLATPADLTLDPAGNIYILEQNTHVVRMVCRQTGGCGPLAEGVIDTIVGGGSGDPADGGLATDLDLGFMNGIEIDANGDLILVDNHHVRRVCVTPGGCGTLPLGHLETLAGGLPGFFGDGGPAVDAQLDMVLGVASDANGNLYVADSANGRVRRLCRALGGGCDADLVGTIDTVAGGGTEQGDGGQAIAASLDNPMAVAITPDGFLAIADDGTYRIRMVCLLPGGCPGLAAGAIGTLAGTGEGGLSGDGGPAVDAPLRAQEMASDAAGNLYFSYALHPRVRFICRTAGGCGEVRTGEIVTLAGPVFAAGDGDFAKGALGTPFDMIWLDDQRLLVADGASGRLRLVDFAAEAVATVVGYPSGFFSKPAPLDRARYAALLGSPFGLVDLSIGSERFVWSSQTLTHDLLATSLIDPDQPITWTLHNLQEEIGTAGHFDANLESSLFDTPAGMVFDPARRSVFVADSGNHVIRQIDVDASLVTTIVGSPDAHGYYGNGVDALEAVLNRPTALALFEPDHLYIADTGNHRVRRVDLSTGIIEDVLGDGTPSSSGTGTPACHFPVFEPQGLALDRYGNLFASSRYAVREVIAGATGPASGSDTVITVYGLPPRDTPPESATICLTGLSFVPATSDDDQLLVLDACQGYLLRLTRGQ